MTHIRRYANSAYLDALLYKPCLLQRNQMAHSCDTVMRELTARSVSYIVLESFYLKSLFGDDVLDEIAYRDQTNHFFVIDDRQMARSFVAHQCHAFLNGLLRFNAKYLVGHDIADF